MPDANATAPETLSRQYYALLVGINDYPSPIAALNGCLKDLDQVEGYLLGQVATTPEATVSQTASGLPVRSYGALHICRLENTQATHRNITGGFREFLRAAGPDDVAWFHFSGHGSEAFTAEEFLPLEPNGKDQTLVCYQDDPQRDLLHLADKELAVLLYEVDSQDLQGRPKKSPHIVVSLDCCHSGSGTRDFEIEQQLKSRMANFTKGKSRPEVAKVEGGIRALASYADGYYAKLSESGKTLEVPMSSHVVLSACESVQLAGDLPAGGVFTSGLITALKSAGGNLNYSDLYIRTRAAVQKIRRENQTPQFDTIGEFNPFTRFLEGSELGSPSRYEVFNQGSTWYVKCGAIHGLPVKAERPVEVEIQTLAPESKPMGRAHLTGIGAQKSTFTPVDTINLEPGKQYQAVLKYLPAPPVLVWVHGEAEGVEALRRVWDASRNIQLVENLEAYGEAQLEVEATADAYLIRDRRTGRLAKEWPRADRHEPIVIDTLGKMVTWERTISLQNEKSAIKDWVDFEIDVAKDPRQPFLTVTEAETIVKADTTNFFERNGALGAFFIPRLRVKGVDQNLYAYLLHLRQNYAIAAYEGEVAYRPSEHEGKEKVMIPMWKKAFGWGLSPGEPQTSSYFKLLVTTEPLDYQQLLQSGIDDRHRDVTFEDWQPMQVENDWYSVTLKVILER